MERKCKVMKKLNHFNRIGSDLKARIITVCQEMTSHLEDLKRDSVSM
jgi:hypothetical protein